jgi:ABC-2 type transport system ATP-binding protein
VLEDVQELCDRVVVLHRGEVVRDGSIPDLLSSAPRSFELCAEAVPAQLAKRIESASTLFRAAGATITAHLPGAELGPRLAAEVHAAGGRLLSLVPERESLEDWFLRLVSGETPPVPVEPMQELEVTA